MLQDVKGIPHGDVLRKLMKLSNPRTKKCIEQSGFFSDVKDRILSTKVIHIGSFPALKVNVLLGSMYLNAENNTNSCCTRNMIIKAADDLYIEYKDLLLEKCPRLNISKKKGY